MGNEEVYEILRQKIDESPRMDMPKTDEIMEILRMRFTPEEAEIGGYLSSDYYKSATAEEVAEQSGKDVEYVRSTLERMLDKGSIFWLNAKDGERFCLMPVFGFFEIPFADGKNDPETRKLAGLWEEFFRKDGTKSLTTPGYRWARVLPASKQTIDIQQKLDQKSVVLTWENAKEYVKAAEEHGRKMALVNCSCRVAFQHCDHPIDACIAIGSAAEFFIRRKKALRELNAEDTLKVLKRNLESGLVLMTNNMQHGQDFICSCCSCCCGLLRSVVEWPGNDVVEKSNFIPVRDENLCTQCGICIEKCQFNAWDDNLNLDEEKCYGCGACEVNCPEDAITMKKVRDLVPERNPHSAWQQVKR